MAGEGQVTNPLLNQARLIALLAGAAVSVGALTVTGNFTQSGATTFATGTGAFTHNGAVTMASGKAFAIDLGTASLPGLAVAGDLNTGIWSSGADALDFTTGGSNRLRITSTAIYSNVAFDVTGTIVCSSTITAANQVLSGSTGSGTGGNFRCVHDGGTQQWLIGILGSVGGRDCSLYNLIAGREDIAISASTGVVTLAGTTASTSTVTGSFVNAGGFGCAGAAYVGSLNTAGNITQTGATTFSTGTGAISLNGAVTAGSTLAVTGLVSLSKGLTCNSFSGGVPGAVTFGASGNDYGYVGYNMAFTSTGGVDNYQSSDTASRVRFSAGTVTLEVAASGTTGNPITWLDALKVDANATAGNTRLLIYDVDNATLERVSVGIADSGGAGYKLLRIAN